MHLSRLPRTPEEAAQLDAAYRPFDPAAAWSAVTIDTARWQRHADALRLAVSRADARAWDDLRARFLRAAALESTALSELIRPVTDITAVVLHRSISEDDWSTVVDATQLVVECHRRALVVAADAAESGQPIDQNLIARLQDLIVESQQTYTVSDEHGTKLEVELPRRQYKPVSNYVFRGDGRLEPFAPAALVAREMQRFTGELASSAFARLHPVLQSAYAHAALTRVHPFADGNGRLARTIASIPLLRAVGLPQVILSDQWPGYARALDRSGDIGADALIELFLATQVNTMDLARSLLERPDRAELQVPLASGTQSPERTLLDLVEVHLRAALGRPAPDSRLAVSRAGGGEADTAALRMVLTDLEGGDQREVTFAVEADEGGWLRLVSSTGEALELWRDDIHPVPVEIAHLRVRSWLDGLLSGTSMPAPVSTAAAAESPLPSVSTAAAVVQVRGIFVVGTPRSGTTLIGSYIGSHPEVLDLAEYGGFYVAHSVAPAYISRLPGREHESFLTDLRRLAVEHATRAARENGCTWFCDATPWNLQIVGSLAESAPDALFVLMLRHFSGAVLSLNQFDWAGSTVADAARLWVTLNASVDQLPTDRTVVIGYDALAAQPAETIAGIREALGSIGLDPDLLDDSRFASSHAAIVGHPRPTVGRLVDGKLAFEAIPSLDPERWSAEIHAQVWPVVGEMHRSLRDRFGELYASPVRPDHVPTEEW